MSSFLKHETKANSVLKEVFHHDAYRSELQEKTISAVLKGNLNMII